MRHDLRERQRRRLAVEAALYDLEIWCDAAQVFVGGLVCQVSEAERLSDLAGREEFLELRRSLACHMCGLGWVKRLGLPLLVCPVLGLGCAGLRLRGRGGMSWLLCLLIGGLRSCSMAER